MRPPSGVRESAFFVREFVKMKKSFVNSWKRSRSWFMRWRNFVREFVKIEKFVREFVNSCIFVYFDSWIYKIAFLESWKPPFISRSWVRENPKYRSWIRESNPPPWGGGSLFHVSYRAWVSRTIITIIILKDSVLGEESGHEVAEVERRIYRGVSERGFGRICNYCLAC